METSTGSTGLPQTYHEILQDELGVKKPTTMHGVEDVLQQSVRQRNTTLKMPKRRPVWQDDVLHDLLQRRRAAHDRSERANLSKLIRKHLRQNMRRRRNARVSQILAEFQDLGRLDSADIASICGIETATLGPLGNIFICAIGHETATLASVNDSDCLGLFFQKKTNDSDCLGLVPPFNLQELSAILKDLHCGKAAGANGMVAEMFKYSNIPLQHVCWIFAIR